jgi:type I restriction enzyme R subunit
VSRCTSTTGELLTIAEARAFYSAASFEERLILPDRVREMTQDLFDCLLGTGGPEQKTIIFCSSDRHADDVAIALNNLYAGWCNANGVLPRQPYAFKCTAASGGAYLSEFKGSASRYFVATTVELLTTGVDVPPCRNVVFFKYVRSPIAFYQMVGRGTRLDPATGKLMFRVYDYTDATRLFGEEFNTRIVAPRTESGEAPESEERERTILVEGFNVRVTDAGRSILTMVDGKATPITVEAYKEKLAAKLVEEAPTLEEFRQRWIVPSERHQLLDGLPDGGRSAALVRTLEDMREYDLYDVLAELGYGLEPHTRQARAGAFEYKHEGWLNTLPKNTATALRALAAQFARGGTESLESPRVFQTPGVVRAGGVASLRILGSPADVIHETKERLFAA